MFGLIVCLGNVFVFGGLGYWFVECTFGCEQFGRRLC